MNYSLIIAGLFFLFNPEVNILDILPDFIGIILIMRGFRPMTSVSATAEESYRNFSRYLAVSAVKAAALIPMISVASSDPSFYMLFTLVFAVLELIFAIPAFSGLWETVSDSAEFAGVSLPSGFRAAGGFTAAFLTLRSFFALAPELVYLYIIQEDVAVYPLAPYKSVLVMICLAVGLILGLVWLICISRVFGALKRNKALTLDITRRISEARVTVAGTVKKAVPKLTLYIKIAAFFTVPFCIDGIPVLPLVVASVLMIFVSKQAEVLYGSPARKPKKLSVISSVLSAVSFIATLVFCVLHQQQAVLSIKRLYLQFAVPAVLRLASCVIFAVLLIRIGEILKKTVREHTGSDNSLPSESRSREELALKTGLAFRIGAVLVIVSTAVAYLLLYTVPVYQIFASAASLVWAGYISRVMESVAAGVGEKYPD